MSSLRRSVVGVDGSEESADAFAWAVAQAEASGDGEVVAVHAFLPSVELFAAAAQVNLDPVRAEHDRLLHNEWISAAEGTGVHVAPELIDNGVAAALVWSSEHHAGAPIVVGNCCDGQHNKHHVGHVAGQLFHRSTGPVIVVNHHTRAVPVEGPLLVAVHGPVGELIPPAKWAATLAQERGLELRVVCITPPLVASSGFGFPDTGYVVAVDEVRKANAQAIGVMQGALRRAYPSVTITSEEAYGHPVEALASLAAETNASLVVIGSHHHNAPVSFLADSVARRLPTFVKCPVVSVPVP